MKLIKKIAAIMFAFMMVVSMSCNVKAKDTEGVYGQKDGSITITGALQGQTYTIYEMLKLESFSGNNYSYTIATGWDDFFKEGAEGAAYMKKDENGYMSFIAGKDGDADRREFAQKALVYAREGHGINTQKKSPLEGKDTVEFTGLNLGYYLVGSTTGSLCGLDTTHKTVEIAEKNSVPTVTKKIIEDTRLVETNTVNYGDIVNFQIDISIGKGAKNYLLHDKMDQGLTLNTSTLPNISPINFHDQSNNNPRYNTDFTVNTTPDDGCTFHVEFKESYLNTLTESVVLTGNYAATVNENAKINEAINNTTWLSYGDNQKTIESKTKTYIYGIKVFKYTKNGTSQEGLKDAQFKLFTDESCANEVNLKKDNDGVTYLVTNTKTGDNIMTSPQLGKFEIKGLKAGTYYLKEIEAPKGYNKLANPIKITISQNDAKNQVVTVGDDTNPVDEVGVENKSGTVLPSTGGAGTTMIYLIGGALVLGSGVVLATKRRVKNK
jgi:hypothetical protein